MRKHVGYQNNGITNGNQGVGATFLGIGADMKMGDLTVSGYTGDEPGDPPYYDGCEISCGFLRSSGKSMYRMYWWDVPAWTEDPEDGGAHHDAIYGWYDADGEYGECFNDVVIKAGQGLWFAARAEYSLTGAGQVLNDTYQITITNGNQLVSNPSPVDTPMGKIWITGYTGDEPGDPPYYDGLEISCGFLRSSGKSMYRMYWWDVPAWTEDEEDGGAHHDAIYGWYDADGEYGECFNGVILKAGQALWFASRGTYQMHFPNPLAKE